MTAERRSGASASILPKEHGTWAMLLVPWATGAGVARQLGAAEIVLLAALLSAFMAHTQLANHERLRLARRPDPAALGRARRLALGFAGLAAAAALPLVVVRERTALLLFGLLGLALTAATLALVRARRDRGLPGQVLAAVALPLAAPTAYYTARGTLGPVAAALWSLNALFFLGAVLYVRLKIAALARRAAGWPVGERLRLAGPTLALDAGILGAAMLTLHAGGLSPLAALAFLPTAIQTAAGVLWLHRPVRLKRLGLLATAHALVFAAVVIWAA
jgi:hypothetical protein